MSALDRFAAPPDRRRILSDAPYRPDPVPRVAFVLLALSSVCSCVALFFGGRWALRFVGLLCLTLLTIARVSAADSCATVKPGPTPGLEWTCVAGGWVPLAPPVRHVAIETPPRTPQPVVALGGFRIGRTYERTETGTRLYFVALGQTAAGVAVYAAECLTEAPQDGCLFVGQGRLIVASANSLGWVEVEP